MPFNKLSLVADLDKHYQVFQDKKEVAGEAAAHEYHQAIADAIEKALKTVIVNVSGVTPGPGTAIGTLQ